MALSYANLTSRVLQFLQDTGAAIYDSTEVGYWIEDEIKRISRFSPVLLDVIFQVESRTGSDTAGTASTLTDTTKSQFLSTDPTNEKVVHNTTDDTWAVVTAYTSTSVLSISKNIMASGESYEIYNKRCTNKRQIYIGDMPSYLWVDSVEYPIGTERNFTQISQNIIELDVEDSTIKDSNSTLTTLNPVDVLVRFAMSQILSQLTDWSGLLSADAAAGDTSVAIDGMAGSEVIKVGEMFNLSPVGAIYTAHRASYIVTTALTLDGTGAGTIASFYPPLEAAALDNCVIAFIKSTLQPSEEDLLERMVVSRAVQSDSIRHINTVPVGGMNTMARYQQWLNNNPLLNSALIQRELQSLAHPRVAKRCSRE